MLSIDKTSAPRNAAKNPETAKPVTKLATIQNMRPFIKNVSKPKVSKLIGRVKINNMGLINMLTRPMINAVHNAVMNPSKVIPGIIQATKRSAIANKIHLISSLSILSPILDYTLVLIYCSRREISLVKSLCATYSTLIGIQFPNFKT